MACRYLELIGANGPNTPAGPNSQNGPNKKAGQLDWFAQWYEATNLPKKTAQRMWQQYADAVGLTITPSKASPEQQQAFAAWHLEQIEQKNMRTV